MTGWRAEVISMRASIAILLMYVASFCFVGMTGTWTTEAVAPIHFQVTGTASEELTPYVKFARKFWAKRGGFANCPNGVETKWYSSDEIGQIAWAILGGCQIWINSNPLAFWHRTSPGQKCTTILHEYGHLIGLGHDPRKWHLMYYRITDIHPACNKFNSRKDLWWFNYRDRKGVPFVP